MWKVRADCTYTSSGNKSTRQAAAQGVVDSYPAAIVSDDPGARFPGGLISHSSTRFTVSYDFVMSAVTASARNSTLLSIHEAV